MSVDELRSLVGSINEMAGRIGSQLVLDPEKIAPLIEFSVEETETLLLWHFPNNAVRRNRPRSGAQG